MSGFWFGRKVLVTGAGGFIGSHVAEVLVLRGARVTAVTSTSGYQVGLLNLQTIRNEIHAVKAELTDYEDCLSLCRDQDVVINAAHMDGSVTFKQARPATIFRQNMLMTLNMLEAARCTGVERFLTLSSTEVYAPDTVVPMPESEGFSGLPAKLTDGYAWSKRMSEFAADTYTREHGLKVAIARPSNIYGPRDHFDPSKGRVIPMFIQKVLQNEGPIIIWGNGEQVRTFLYVGDLAHALLDLVEKYPTGEAVNFGGTQEITIKALADLIVRLSGKDIGIICDLEKPQGSPHRTPDTTRARELLGFTGTTPLEVGLQRTIDEYRQRSAQQETLLITT